MFVHDDYLDSIAKEIKPSNFIQLKMFDIAHSLRY